MARRTAVRAAAIAAVVTLAGVVAVSVGAWQGDDATARGTAPGSSPTTQSPPPPNDVTNGDGSEVIEVPEEPGATGLPGLRRAESDPTTPLVTSLPRTATRQGALVAGFPVSVVPVESGASVRSSGVSSTRDTVQVSIVARSPRSPGAVVAFYRRALAPYDFEESVAPAPGGAVAAQFTRGEDHLVVTTSRDDGETSYSVFGTLHADADD